MEPTASEPSAPSAGAEVSEIPAEVLPIAEATAVDAAEPATQTPAEAAADVTSAAAPDPEVLAHRELARLDRIAAFLRENAAALGLPEDSPPELQARTRATLAEFEQRLVAALESPAVTGAPPEQRESLTRQALETSVSLPILVSRLRAVTALGLDLDAANPFDVLRRAETTRDEPELFRELFQRLDSLVPAARRLEALLAATESRDLRRLLDAGSGLPDAWKALYADARLVFTVIVRGQTNPRGPRPLHRAVRTLLRSGARSLLGRAPVIRERLILHGLRLRLEGRDLETLDRFQDSMRGETTELDLEVERVRSLLGQQRFEPAAKRLSALKERFPNEERISRWLRALERPRFGCVALLDTRVKPPVDHEHALRPGWSSSDQRDVWLRVGDPANAAVFAQHVDLHRRAEIPCVSVVHEAGLTKSQRPYVAYARRGDNAKHALFPARGASREDALVHARQLLQFAYGLGRAGVVLPDADFGRFELDASGQLWLVESWGLRSEPIDAALEGMLSLAKTWLLALLGSSSSFCLADEVRDNLTHAGDFATLRACLDALGRSRSWEC